MTNFERFKDDIIEIGVTNLGKINDELVECTAIKDCQECDFYNKSEGRKECDRRLTNWLFKEYQEEDIKLRMIEQFWLEKGLDSNGRLIECRNPLDCQDCIFFESDENVDCITLKDVFIFDVLKSFFSKADF